MWRMSTVRAFEEIGIRKVKLPAGMTVDQAVAIYQGDPDVLYAEPNYRYRIQALPDDEYMAQLWGLHNTGQSVSGTRGTADADMNASLAWDMETGSRDIVVAVVDSGVDVNHPDLAANIWTHPTEIPGNGIDDDDNGYVDDVHGWDFADGDNNPIDSHGHGTHVAGIVGAAGHNGLGITGICWRVSIMPLRFIPATGYGTTEHAIDAIRYAAANGADVINLSWGGPGYSLALKNAIDAAGALVVCAAGNQGINLDQTPFYPAGYASANILSIGATDADDHPAWFTNYSDSRVDVAAPGTQILSTVPDRQTLLADNFSNLSNWSFGIDSAWDLQSDNGNKRLTESPDAYYSNNMNSWARLNPLNLSGFSGTRLDFTIMGRSAGPGDRLYVEASTDGTHWSPLWVGLPDGPVQAITGTLTTWQTATADLKAYDGVGSLDLRLRFVSDASGTADGYLIDNLTVTCADTTHGSSEYRYFQGTSMSAAYASGAAALLMARNPSLTPTEVKLVIESTVDIKPQLEGYVATAGRINVYDALLSIAAVELRSRAASTDRIDLDWTAMEPVESGFEIQRRKASGEDYTTIALLGTEDTAYTDSGLVKDTTYVYRLLTLSGGARTGYSNETTVTTPQRLFAESAGSGGGGGGGGGGCFISVAGN
jgi:subtilisin family serine protease